MEMSTLWVGWVFCGGFFGEVFFSQVQLKGARTNMIAKYL